MDPNISICPPLIQIWRQSPRNTRPYPRCLWDSGTNELSDLYGNPWQAARFIFNTDRSNREGAEFWIFWILLTDSHFPLQLLKRDKKGVYGRIIWDERQEQDCTRSRIICGGSHTRGFKKATTWCSEVQQNPCSRIRWHSCPGNVCQ